MGGGPNQAPVRLHLNGGRNQLKLDDERLRDKVANNLFLDNFTTDGEEILSGNLFH